MRAEKLKLLKILINGYRQKYKNMGNIKLYYHKTSGGAEYLTDTFVEYEYNGIKGKEGTITDKTKYAVRIDGNIEKDAELMVR